MKQKRIRIETRLTTLNLLGEANIIQLLQPYLDQMAHLGSNEDAYLITNAHPYILLNVDSMSRTSDFLPKQSWAQIGKKLVVSTFSDIAAKGGTPTTFLASLVLEKNMEEKALKCLVNGIKEASQQYKSKYLGGDLGTATETVLTGIGTGYIEKGNILARKNARVGDLVCVTGDFGLTSLGLKTLLSREREDELPDFLIEAGIKQLYEPKARILEGTILSNSNFTHACIDSSDGLAISLHWLSEASKTGFLITELPLNKKLKEYIQSEEKQVEMTLYGGDEYELVFTVPANKGKVIENLFRENGCTFTVIGECIEKTGVYLKGKKEITTIKKIGWDAFRPQNGLTE